MKLYFAVYFIFIMIFYVKGDLKREDPEEQITTTETPLVCTYMFCFEYTCDDECLLGESRWEDCSHLVCGKRFTQIFKNDTYIICAKVKHTDCQTTTTIISIETSTTTYLPNTTTASSTETYSTKSQIPTTTSIPASPTPQTTTLITSTELTNLFTTLVTTSRRFPCTIIDGMVSYNFIADHQILINGKSDTRVANLRKSDSSGLKVSLKNPVTISIDFTENGNRESPFINQITLGKNIGVFQLSITDKDGLTSKVTEEFSVSPGVIELNQYIKNVEFEIISGLHKEDSIFINLEVLGCFKNITGCMIEGRHYENHQSLNATKNPETCSSKICYCTDHKVSCRTTTQNVKCAENEVKTCSKVTTDLTCCTCVKNVTEAYCQIDYLCNPHCGVCLDESDIWGKEFIIKNATECVCKDGYQSFIESYEDKKDSKIITHINAKCMSYTVDESTCAPKPTTTTRPPPRTTTTTSTTTSKPTPPIIITTTKHPVVIVTTSTASTTTSRVTPPIIVTTTSPLVETTTTATARVPTTINITTSTSKIITTPTPEISSPETTISATFSTTSTIGVQTTKTSETSTKHTTVSTPTITTTQIILTTTPKTCLYLYCETYTCDKSCIVMESRKVLCSALICVGKSKEVDKNETQITCAKYIQKCETTLSLSTPSISTTITTPLTTTSSTTAPTTTVTTTTTTTVSSTISKTFPIIVSTERITVPTTTEFIGTTTLPVVITTPTKCTYRFCEKITCDKECIYGENRYPDCSKLVCTGRNKEVFKNATYIICARTVETECKSEVSTTTLRITTSIPTTLLTSFTTTVKKPCTVVYCSLYTCYKQCENPTVINTECSGLFCRIGAKEVERNATVVYCASSIDIHCKTSTVKILTTTTVIIPTTRKPSVCDPVMKLNEEKYVAELKKSTNLGGNELDTWITSPNDYVPQLEMTFKNPMTIVEIVLTRMNNIQKMNLMTSEDGKTFKVAKRYEGGYEISEVAETFSVEPTPLLSFKLVIIQRYEESRPISFSMNVNGCGKVCPPPLVHVNCSCPQTCDMLANTNGLTTCPTTCFPGCQCPEGMVNNNGKCIKVPECPCYYNGRPYAFGDKISTGEPCKFLICTKESLQEIIEGNCTTTCKETMNPCTCDGCHKTCEKNNIEANCNLNSCKSGCCCPNGTIYSEILDKCVKHCPCMYENKTYEIGEKWKNRCLDCRCDEVRGAYCLENGCDFDQCPPRHKLVNESPNDNICCKCVKIDPVCVFNGKEYKVGEVWNDGPCRTFTCKMKEGQTMVTTSKTKCPPLECPPTHVSIQLPGECCEQCIPKNITTTLAPITTTTRKPSNCQRKSNNIRLKLNGCESSELVDVGSCEGSCPSSSALSYIDGSATENRDCKCCSLVIGRRVIEYTCPGNVKKEFTSTVISDCQCNTCT